jgi:hypothetical protein
MRTTVRDRFELGEEAFWRDVFFDHVFLERLYREAMGARTFEIVDEKGDLASGLTRHLRFSQKVDAPAPVRKLFGETTTMEEEGRFDATSRRWTFHIRPGTMPDKVKIQGTTWLEPDGSGVVRISELDFSVSIFGVGGLVERYMAKETQDSMAKQTAFIRARLSSRTST